MWVQTMHDGGPAVVSGNMSLPARGVDVFRPVSISVQPFGAARSK
jgi:hypothetical protein